MERGNYKKFALMLLVSFVIMYGVMFLNVDQFSHVFINLNRLYMALLMVAPMAILMILFMPGMYKDKKVNVLIISGSLVVIVGTFIMLRSQTFVDDTQFMKSMIPHHSSAILVSQEANLKNPEVKKLAQEIITSQKKEIAEMKGLLKKIENE